MIVSAATHWHRHGASRAQYAPPPGRLGRPLVDRVKGSAIHNLKELCPGSAGSSEIRVLFAFDPWRSAVLLLAGDKAGDWKGWYRHAVPRAEELYATYLKERADEEGTP
jgi:hypothetical protein